jgi:hypothetical protein
VIGSACPGDGLRTNAMTVMPCVIGLAFLLGVYGAPAMADSGCALKEVASLPADFKHGDIRVDVGIGGETVKFVIGTGTTRTEIGSALVKRMGLTRSGPGGRINSARGTVEVDNIVVPDLKVGAMAPQSATLAENDAWSDGTNGGVAGLLGQDFLISYDVEIDPSQGVVNLFIPIECTERSVYWWNEHFELPLSVAPHKALAAQIILDGKGFRAYVDSGTPVSSVDIAEAKRALDLPSDIEAPLPARVGSGVPSQPNPIYTFKELVFGPVTLRHPKLELRRYRVLANVTSSHIAETYSSETPVVIGMDVLGKFHSMISFRHDMLYFTLPNERNPAPPKS